jgi:hypothetical protein
MDRRDQVVRFYDILGELKLRLGGTRKLVDCNGKMGWPTLGVYFFFEEGEMRSTSGDGIRVVRVGTQALKAKAKSSLWGRLAQHRGREGGGQHRASVFRLLVGDALKSQSDEVEPNTWACGSSPGKAASNFGMSGVDVIDGERELEARVSRRIGAIPMLWVSIEDEPGPKSLRGYLERNAIALLSNYQREPMDGASDRWLGRHSSREAVRHSGLWNNHHVDERHDHRFLEDFERLVLRMTHR